MLFPFTMQQFLIASAVLAVVWYGGVFLWFSRRRGLGLLFDGAKGLQQRSGASVKLRPALAGQGRGPQVQEDYDEQELMGKVKLPEGVELIASQELRFAGSIGAESGSAIGQSDQLGLIPDVLEEIKEVFGILAKKDGSKQDFLSLMGAVREKYPKIGSHPGLLGLNAFIRDHAGFHLSDEELENLWD